MEGKDNQTYTPSHEVIASQHQQGVLPQQQIITPGWQQPPSAQQPLVQVQAQPQSFVVIDGIRPTVVEKYNSRQSKALGIAQLCFGGLALALSGGGFGIQTVFDSRYHAFGRPTFGTKFWAGLWGSSFIFFSGAFAVCSANRKTLCTIRTHLGMSIIASLLGFVMFGIFVVDIVTDNQRIRDYGSQWGAGWQRPYAEGSLAVSALLFVVAVVQILLSIWSSVFAYKVLCCNENGCSCCEYSDIQPADGTRPNVPNTSSQSQLFVVDRHGHVVQNAQVVHVSSAYPRQPGFTQMPQTSLDHPGPMVFNPTVVAGFQQPASLAQTGAGTVTTSQQDDPPPMYEQIQL